MNDIAWGPEIIVNGVRPKWLRGAEKIDWRWQEDGDTWASNNYPYYLEGCAADDVAIENGCKAIRLRADHPHYADDTVAVKRVTVMEFHDMFEAMGWQPALESLGYQWAVPTPLEQFLADHPDADRATAELAFARWGEE